MTARVISIGVCLLLAVTSLAAAPIYTWQDDDGRTHFSDRPLNEDAQIRKTDIDTRIPVANGQKPAASSGYTIREQMDYFDRKREEKRQAWLEEQKLKQARRTQDLQAQYLRQQAKQQQQPPPAPVIISQPYYPPYYRQPPGYRMPTGIQTTSPYALRYLHQGDHHRFNLNIGNPNQSYPLNFWKN